MFEIVAFHVGQSTGAEEPRLPIIAGLGLPTFLLLNNAFNCTLAARMGTRAFLEVKVRRLLLPWLVWSLVYAAVVVLERVRHDEPLSTAFSPWVLIGGTYDHLWFVPFALFGGLLVAGLQAVTMRLSHLAVSGSALVLGAFVVVIDALILQSFAIDWPALQWLFSLPSPLLGFALGRSLLGVHHKLLWRLGLLLSIGAAACLAASLWVTVPEMVLRYAISMALVTLAFVWPGAAERVSQRLTPLLFGIYLTHPLIVRVYQGTHWPAPPAALLSLAVFGVAAMLVAVLQQSPLRRLV